MMALLVLACTIEPTDFCFSPGACDERLIQLVDRAATSVDVAIYSLNRASIVKALLAAKARGVAVRVLLDRLQSSNHREAAVIRQLTRAGIEHHTAHHTGIMHQKVAIVDRKWAVWGSFNWTDQAVEHNDEVVSYAACPDVAERFSADFDGRWTAAKVAEGLVP